MPSQENVNVHLTQRVMCVNAAQRIPGDMTISGAARFVAKTIFLGNLRYQHGDIMNQIRPMQKH